MKNYSDNEILKINPSLWIIAGFVLVPLGFITVFGLSPWSLIGIGIFVYKYYEVQCWTYTFNEMTIVERKGVFNVLSNEIHYYRIKSVQLDEPFWMRLLGLSIIRIETTDRFLPHMILFGIHDGQRLLKSIREKTYIWRQEMNVREIDVTDSVF